MSVNGSKDPKTGKNRPDSVPWVVVSAATGKPVKEGEKTPTYQGFFDSAPVARRLTLTTGVYHSPVRT